MIILFLLVNQVLTLHTDEVLTENLNAKALSREALNPFALKILYRITPDGHRLRKMSQLLFTNYF